MPETPTTITPLPADYQVGAGARELAATGPANTAQQAELLAETPEPHLSVWLDWAAELRKREGLSWPDALHVAGIFYFG
jgi:hypothetical protein